VNHHRLAIISGVVAATSSFALSIGTVAQAAPSSPYPAAKAQATAPRSGPVPGAAAESTVRTVLTSVDGTRERILVDAKGLPLYYFGADTAKRSNVTGGLAQLWPPLLSANPSASGVTGKVMSLQQPNDPQVAYNGHFLYTFVDDSAGHVTGQGVSNFFVATPNIRAIGNSAVVKIAPAHAAASRGYGY
jgi:predicted lipoprotein with Yx(FWY)xxD motif